MKQIIFCNPRNTTSLSVTGDYCELKCAHCNGHFLFGMRTFKEAVARDSRSYLVSGGCELSGMVPITEGVLRKLKRNGARLNVHSGLVDEGQAKMIGKYADAISFDFVGDDETIRDVYDSGKSVQDYAASYALLRRYARVVPHICIGIRGGKLSGELKALDRLAELGADALTFIVFMPVKGTIYEGCNPPSEEDVKRVFGYARKRFPDAYLSLGCMRPRRLYDVAAVEAGFDCIVLPSRKAVELCKERRISVVEKDECCSL